MILSSLRLLCDQSLLKLACIRLQDLEHELYQEHVDTHRTVATDHMFQT